MSRKKNVWITWEKQIRNKSMSKRLGCVYSPIISNKKGLLRYMECLYRTFSVLRENQNGTVFVQNPSIVLALSAIFFKVFFSYRLIVDAHNSGVFPRKQLQFLCNYVNKNADLVIVTNQALCDFVSGIGGRAVVLPDPLPDIEIDEDISSSWTDIPLHSVVAICSWADDEPYVEIIAAATLLPEIIFYITGNSKGRQFAYSNSLPKNVILTGYLSDNDYHNLIKNVGVIIDLTTRDDCLVCGAYEAISVAKPVVLSDTAALKAYFNNEAIFVKNTRESIADGLRQVFGEYAKFDLRAKENAELVESRWLSLFCKASPIIYKE